MRLLPPLAVIGVLLSCVGVAKGDDSAPSDKLSPSADPYVASARYDGPGRLHQKGSDSVRAEDGQVHGVVPIIAGASGNIQIAGGYRWTRYEVEQGGRSSNQVSLHRFDLEANAEWVVSQHFAINISLGGLFASDLHGADISQARQPALSAAGTYALGSSDAIIFGAGLSRQFFSLSPFPILGYVHEHEGSPFRLEVILPNYIRAQYDVSRYLRVAAGAEFEGLAWALGREGAVPPHDMQSQQLRVYQGLRFRLFGPLSAEARVGADVYSAYNFRTESVANLPTVLASPAGYLQLLIVASTGD